MTDRPIIFRAPMVQALLDGRKTQDRRVLKGVPDQPAAKCHPSHSAKHPVPYLDAYCGEKKTLENPRGMSTMWNWWQVDNRMCWPQFKVPCAIGDRLWVQEGHMRYEGGQICAPHYLADGPRPSISDRHDAGLLRGYSSIHMPRWASRLTLAVTDVRVQRLQDITDEDAQAEGMPSIMNPEPVEAYRNLWNSLHGPNAWDENPWVAALTFTVQRGNIDKVGSE